MTQSQTTDTLIPGFIRASDAEDAACISVNECKMTEPPAECPAGEEKIACLDSCFATCDDHRRGVKRTENCDAGECIKNGCACPAGQVRKDANPTSPCVPADSEGFST